MIRQKNKLSPGLCKTLRLHSDISVPGAFGKATLIYEPSSRHVPLLSGKKNVFFDIVANAVQEYLDNATKVVMHSATSRL